MARRKRLLRLAGGLARGGKDFFGSLAGYGALEKTFLGRWTPRAAWQSLFWRAGGRFGRIKMAYACVFMKQVV